MHTAGTWKSSGVVPAVWVNTQRAFLNKRLSGRQRWSLCNTCHQRSDLKFAFSRKPRTLCLQRAVHFLVWAFPPRWSASLWLPRSCARIYLLAVASVHFWMIYKHNEQVWFEPFLVGFLKISALLTLALTHASGIKWTVSGFESSLRGTTPVCTFRKKCPVGMPAVLCYFTLCIFSFNNFLSHSGEW